jgi:hypothetical protein
MRIAKLLLYVSLSAVGASNAVELKLVVKERFGRPPQERPFPDLTGFTLSASPFAGSAHPATSCPGATDRKGEVSCTVDCKPHSPISMRLYVQGPRPEASPAVKGYVDPDPQVVQLDRCVLRTRGPVVVMYRTPESYYSESLMMFPAVFEAAGLKQESWQPTQKIMVRPFTASASNLEALARRDPINIEGIERLSKLAATYQRLPGTQKNVEAAKIIEDYQYGAGSIVLRALAVSGSVPPSTVKISPAAEDYFRSISNVESQLQSRPVLNATQLKLYEDIKTFRQSAPVGGIITIESVMRSRPQ